MSFGLIALFAGPVILIPLACYALAHRRVRGATWYGLLLLTIAFWSLVYARELAAPSLWGKMLALKVKYIGVVLVPSTTIGFILSFVGFPPARVRQRVRPLVIVSGAMLLLAWTDHWHGLFWGPLSLYEMDGYTVLRGRGPLFWFNVVYTYCVLAIGIILLAVHAVHSPYLYRKRATILMIGAIVPWVGNVVFVMSFHETIVDPTPFLFSCTAVIAALAVFRYDLLEPVPTLTDARIESIGDGVVILDRRQRVADLNPSAETFLRRRRAEASGAAIGSLLPGWPAGTLPSAPIDVSIGTPPEIRIYDVRCTEVRSRAGETTGAVVMLRDVTEWRLAERALRESEQRYRTVIEQSSDGVWLADRDGAILDVNPGACAMLGYARSELVGRYGSDLSAPEDTVPALPRLEDVRHGEAVDWLWRIRSKDDQERLLSGRSTLIATDMVLSTFRDITEERAEAERRDQLLLDAQAGNRLKDEFLATLSHELRTPIAAVLGWTRMLVRKEVEPARVAHALNVIERNALAQSRLVDDVLDLSRLSSQRLPLTLAETNLTALVGEALDAIGPSAQARQLTFDVELSPALPLIVADTGRIQQVLWNLLTNAIKFTPNGGTVAVTGRAVADGVELTVRDSGKGIAPEFLPFVFEPFRQADGSRSPTGLGLGLAIVRRIIEAHGGRVEATSEGLGLGATFRMFLPTSPSSAASAGEDGNGSEAEPASTESPASVVSAEPR